MKASAFSQLAPDLDEAIDRAHAEGLAYMILDGILIPIDRCAEQDR
ncbi:hypothetical protein [Nonomuraea sp. NPDC049709]